MKKIIVYCYVLTTFLCLAISINASLAFAQTQIYNPYEDVDWERCGHYKANLHSHTTNSDGKLDPDQVIAEYYNRDYGILSITDHNHVTWPWSDYTKTDSVGMLSVQGNEISNNHHMLSYFTDYKSSLTNKKEVLTEIGEKGGLVVMAHPGRYNASAGWYAELYEKHPNLIGFEAINQGNRYSDDLKLWDKVLSILPADNLVWGFSNDDMHKHEHLGRDWNVFLLTELSEQNLKNAMIKGQFYFSSISTVDNPVGLPPVINSVDVDREDNMVSIQAENYDKVVWISNGKIIHIGESINYKNAKGLQNYLRAEVIGQGGVSYTQPIGFK
ncbi:hypothetical protein PRVXH_000452 [Proteinivorax hydrogeniformans]|uniref:Polymerase/histidinol phosphatase N-terminal domain-containing protein n=1 Tax=Proteinivorax hydrogeniformans TaxID=1826727 RepID=A0AAU8HUS4_9FIRM